MRSYEAGATLRGDGWCCDDDRASVGWIYSLTATMGGALIAKWANGNYIVARAG